MVHPTSKSGAKKRLIATFTKLKIQLSPGEPTLRQFLIATKNDFPDRPVIPHRRSQPASRLSQRTDRDPRIAADLIANGILESLLTHSKQSIRTCSNREKTGIPLQLAIHASRFTPRDSRLTNHDSRHLRHLRLNFPLYAHPHFAIVIALLAFLRVSSARQRPRGTRHAEAFPHSQPKRWFCAHSDAD